MSQVIVILNCLERLKIQMTEERERDDKGKYVPRPLTSREQTVKNLRNKHNNSRSTHLRVDWHSYVMLEETAKLFNVKMTEAASMTLELAGSLLHLMYRGAQVYVEVDGERFHVTTRHLGVMDELQNKRDIVANKAHAKLLARGGKPARKTKLTARQLKDRVNRRRRERRKERLANGELLNTVPKEANDD